MLLLQPESDHVSPWLRTFQWRPAITACNALLHPWPYSLLLSPCLHHSSHTGLLAVPQTYQAQSYPRALECAVPTAYTDCFPTNYLVPSPPSGFYSNVIFSGSPALTTQYNTLPTLSYFPILFNFFIGIYSLLMCYTFYILFCLFLVSSSRMQALPKQWFLSICSLHISSTKHTVSVQLLN